MKATFLTAGLYAFFRAMKSLMSGAAGQSKEFSAALEGVKSNLRTAFAPILDAVLPALTALMQGLRTPRAPWPLLSLRFSGRPLRRRRPRAKSSKA